MSIYTNRRHVGISLWQIQQYIPKIVRHASKTLLGACKHYSVTELEMTDLGMGINLWKHLLYHEEFNCAISVNLKSIIKPVVPLSFNVREF